MESPDTNSIKIHQDSLVIYDDNSSNILIEEVWDELILNSEV